MSIRYMSDILLTLLAAGSVKSFPEASQWCLNESLVALDSTARRDGRLCDWTRSVTDLVGCKSAIVMQQPGTGTESYRQGLQELLGDGLLVRHGAGPFATLVVGEEAQVRGRRVLFSLPSEDADLFYAEGRNVANRLSTSAKNWAKSASEATVRSATPGRRLQLVVGR